MLLPLIPQPMTPLPLTLLPLTPLPLTLPFLSRRGSHLEAAKTLAEKLDGAGADGNVNGILLFNLLL